LESPHEPAPRLHQHASDSLKDHRLSIRQEPEKKLRSAAASEETGDRKKKSSITASSNVDKPSRDAETTHPFARKRKKGQKAHAQLTDEVAREEGEQKEPCAILEEEPTDEVQHTRKRHQHSCKGPRRSEAPRSPDPPRPSLTGLPPPPEHKTRRRTKAGGAYSKEAAPPSVKLEIKRVKRYII